MKVIHEVLTDHFQFYVGDSQLWQEVDTTDLWKNKKGLVEATGLISIGTVRFGGFTRVELLVNEEEISDKVGVEKIGDFKLSVPSGQLLIWGPEHTNSPNVVKVLIPAGEYLGFAYSVGTESIVDEMSERGAEKYVVVLKQR